MRNIKFLSFFTAVATVFCMLPAEPVTYAEDTETVYYKTDFTDTITNVPVGTGATLQYNNNMYAFRSAVKTITENGNTYVQMSTVGGTSTGYNLGFLTNDNNKITDNLNWKTDQNFVQECDIYIPRSLAAETTSNTDALNFGISYNGVQDCTSTRANMAIYGAGAETDFVSVQPGVNVNYGAHGGVSPTTIRTISTDEWHNIKYISDYSGIDTTNGCMVKVYVDNEYFFTYSTKDSSSFSVFRGSSTDSIKAIGLKTWTANSGITGVYFDNLKYYQLDKAFDKVSCTYENGSFIIEMSDVIDSASNVKVTDSKGNRVSIDEKLNGKKLTISSDEFVTGKMYSVEADKINNMYGNSVSSEDTLRAGDAPEFCKADCEYNKSEKSAFIEFSNQLDSCEDVKVFDSENNEVNGVTTAINDKRIELTFAEPLVDNSIYSIKIAKVCDIYDQIIENNEIELSTYPIFEAIVDYNAKDCIIKLTFSNELSQKGSITVKDSIGNTLTPTVEYSKNSELKDVATLTFPARFKNDDEHSIEFTGFLDFMNKTLKNTTLSFTTVKTLDFTKCEYVPAEKKIYFSLTNNVENRGVLTLYDSYNDKINSTVDWTDDKNGVVSITDGVTPNTAYKLVFDGIIDEYTQPLTQTSREYSFTTPPVFSAEGNVNYNQIANTASADIVFTNNVSEGQEDKIVVKNKNGGTIDAEVSISDNIITVTMNKLYYSTSYKICVAQDITDIYGQTMQEEYSIFFETKKDFDKALYSNDMTNSRIADKEPESFCNWDPSSLLYNMYWGTKTDVYQEIKPDDSIIKLFTEGSTTIDRQHSVAFSNTSSTAFSTGGVSMDSNIISEANIYLPSTLLSELSDSDKPLYFGLAGDGINTYSIKGGMKFYKGLSEDKLTVDSVSNVDTLEGFWKCTPASQNITVDEWHNIKFVVDMPSSYQDANGRATIIKVLIDDVYFCSYTYVRGTAYVISQSSNERSVAIRLYTKNQSISAVYLDDLKAYQMSKEFLLESVRYDKEQKIYTLKFSNNICDIKSVNLVSDDASSEIKGLMTANADTVTYEIKSDVSDSLEFSLVLSDISDIYGNKLSLKLNNFGVYADTLSSDLSVANSGVTGNIKLCCVDDTTQPILCAVAAYGKNNELLGVDYYSGEVSSIGDTFSFNVLTSEKPSCLKMFMWETSAGNVKRLISDEIVLYGEEKNISEGVQSDLLSAKLTNLGEKYITISGKTTRNKPVSLFVLNGENADLNDVETEPIYVGYVIADENGYYRQTARFNAPTGKYKVYSLCDGTVNSSVFNYVSLIDIATIAKKIKSGEISDAGIYTNIASIADCIGSEISAVKSQRDKDILTKRCYDGRDAFIGSSDEKYYYQLKTAVDNSIEEIKLLQKFDKITSSYMYETLFNELTSIENNAGVSLTAYNALSDSKKVKVGEIFLAHSGLFNNSDEIVSLLNSAVTKVSNTNGGENGGGGNVSYNPPVSMVGSSVGDKIFSNNNSNSNETYGRFKDISDFEWANGAIYRLVDLKIIDGISENEFAPKDEITREQFVKLLVTSYGSYFDSAKCDFSDVSDNMWYSSYIASAFAAGIANGIDDGRFGVGMNIKRQDMAVLIYNALNKLGYQFIGSKTDFTDYEQVSDYAKDAVAALASAGIITGMDNGDFAPMNTATRAEAAVIIDRFYTTRSSL